MTMAADDPRLSTQGLSPAAELAVLGRILFRAGYDDANLGHMTYTQDDGTLLTLPWELGWDEVRDVDVMRIDIDGNVLDGRWTVSPAIKLHLELHKARPGCRVTIHNHPRYATVWSATRRIPAAYDQRAAFAWTDEIVVYDDYGGDVGARQEAAAAVAAIGNANYALLANHGVMVIAGSIAQAHGRAVALEHRCALAFEVEALGGGLPMPEHGQEALRRTMARYDDTPPIFWDWAARRELRADPTIVSASLEVR